MIQKTLGIIKPDATERQLIGSIINDLEQTDLKIVGLKMVKLTNEVAEEFYKEHTEKPFFKSLISYMTSNEIVVFSLEGENAVLKYREIMGATNPKDAKEGSLRFKYAESLSRNSVHGSDSIISAKRELDIFDL